MVSVSPRILRHAGAWADLTSQASILATTEDKRSFGVKRVPPQSLSCLAFLAVKASLILRALKPTKLQNAPPYLSRPSSRQSINLSTEHTQIVQSWRRNAQIWKPGSPCCALGALSLNSGSQAVTQYSNTSSAAFTPKASLDIAQPHLLRLGS